MNAWHARFLAGMLLGIAAADAARDEMVVFGGEAGADQVLPRSTFTEQLPQILRDLSEHA